MKVVVDSNIYISAFLFDKDPEVLIDLGIGNHFKIYSSLYIISEVRRVLHEKLGTSERFAHLAAKRVERHSSVVQIRGVRGPIPTDPKDGPIIKTCLACRADFLVTGDKALATLKVHGTIIVSVSQFLRHLQSQGIS